MVTEDPDLLGQFNFINLVLQLPRLIVPITNPLINQDKNLNYY